MTATTTDQHRVLIVDDEQNVLRALKRLLLDEPYDVLTAGRGREALEILQATPCTVVLSDYRMPEMHGIEFLQEVAAQWPETVRILLTGYAEFSVAMKAINAGQLYKLLSKPWNDVELKLVLQEACARYDLLRERAGMQEQIRAQNSELHTLNENLEALVAERTQSLEQALQDKAGLLQELELRVKELEGKDRVLHHLLEVHPMEETLRVGMEVIHDILPLQALTVYAIDDTGMLAMAGHWNGDGMAMGTASQATATGLPLQVADLERARELAGAQSRDGCQGLCVPMQKGEDVLGAVLAQVADDTGDPATIHGIIEGIAGLLAVAVADTRACQNFSTISGEIDKILKGSE